MTWSKVYTAAAEDANDHSFMVYFFDTYLNGKTDWSVSAHPDSSAFKRSFTHTMPLSIYTNSSFTTYYYADWGSTTSPSQVGIYLDIIYTSTPGDLGTGGLVNNYGFTTITTSDNWTIWESSIDTEAWAVYRKRELMFYWPGSQKSFQMDNGLWDGTGTTYRGRTWLEIGGKGQQYGNPNFVGGFLNSSNSYYLAPDCGGASWSTAPISGDLPVCWQGIQWMVTDLTTPSFLTNDSFPMLERTGSDTAYKYGTTNSPDTRSIFPSNSPTVYVYEDTVSGKFYLHHSSSATDSCVVFDCGLTEPVI